MFKFYQIQYSKKDIIDDSWVEFNITMTSNKTGHELYEEMIAFIKTDFFNGPYNKYPYLFLGWFNISEGSKQN